MACTQTGARTDTHANKYANAKHAWTPLCRSAILEVKTRRNQFHKNVSLQELAQMHAYMHLTGIHAAVQIQMYRGDMETVAVPWDESFWNALLLRVCQFTKDPFLCP